MKRGNDTTVNKNGIYFVKGGKQAKIDHSAVTGFESGERGSVILDYKSAEGIERIQLIPKRSLGLPHGELEVNHSFSYKNLFEVIDIYQWDRYEQVESNTPTTLRQWFKQLF